jgi:hypothetical protein
MSIDKSDVRFVVHASVPESMDSYCQYYQQIGRAPTEPPFRVPLVPGLRNHGKLPASSAVFGQAISSRTLTNAGHVLALAHRAASALGERGCVHACTLA